MFPSSSDKGKSFAARIGIGSLPGLAGLPMQVPRLPVSGPSASCFTPPPHPRSDWPCATPSKASILQFIFATFETTIASLLITIADRSDICDRVARTLLTNLSPWKTENVLSTRS